MSLLVGEVVGLINVPIKDNLKHITVDVGHEIKVVTNAPNIVVGSRTVIATVGAQVTMNDGDVITVEKTLMNGCVSEGIVCDSKMCGWAGGAVGIAVQIPTSIAIGSPCPEAKPRGEGFQDTTPKELSIKEKKELEKQARKLALKEKREAKKLAKDGQ